MKIKYLIPAFAALLSLAACSTKENYTVATGEVVTSVTTDGAAFTATTADLEGTVLDLSDLASGSYSVGFCYGTSSDPISNGKKVTGTFDVTTGKVYASLSSLTADITYYYATYVLLSGKVYYYGDIRSFVTTDAAISTSAATDVTATSAVVGGVVNVAADGISSGATSLTYGIKITTPGGNTYSKSTSDTKTSFDVTLNGLIPGMTYTYQSFLDVDGTITYGAEQTFTTETMEMEYVDLGLSVMWAKCNFGADEETDYGASLGWADVEGFKLSEYNINYTPTSDIVGTDDDPVFHNHAAIDGSATTSSMLPTATQFQELLNGTTHEWTTVDGVAGMKFTAKNGNYIFLPAVGYREGEELVSEETLGDYWTGNIDPTDSEHGQTLLFSEGNAGIGTAEIHCGLSIRPVREYEYTKLQFFNKDGDGTTARIEIYNEYGPTAGNPAIDLSEISFSDNMVVKFKISGMNLKEDASGSYLAGLEYAANGWYPSYWSSCAGEKYDAKVTGDGIYTVWMETGGATASGAVVFCIDIPNLWGDLTNGDDVLVTLESIEYDVDVTQPINTDIVQFQNKDGNGTDGRIEIYNEYGNAASVAPGYYNDILKFKGAVVVNFTISGIDGNLVDGASNSYNTELSFADADWGPSYWGGAGYGNTTVTGDGTYEVYALMESDCYGAVVWTIEIYGLWADLVDTSAVSVTVNSIKTPGKLE